MREGSDLRGGMDDGSTVVCVDDESRIVSK